MQCFISKFHHIYLYIFLIPFDTSILNFISSTPRFINNEVLSEEWSLKQVRHCIEVPLNHCAMILKSGIFEKKKLKIILRQGFRNVMCRAFGLNNAVDDNHKGWLYLNKTPIDLRYLNWSLKLTHNLVISGSNISLSFFLCVVPVIGQRDHNEKLI